MEPTQTWQIRLEILVKKIEDYHYPGIEPVKRQFRDLKKKLIESFATKDITEEDTNISTIEGDFLDLVEHAINIKPFDEEPTTITQYENAYKLIKAINAFQKLFKNHCIDLSQKVVTGQGRVVVAASHWYIHEIISCIQHIKLESISFGTFFSDGYNSHWTIEDRLNKKDDDDISVDFLFDQSQVNVRFYNEERNYHSATNNYVEAWALYQIQILMHNIRKIYVELTDPSSRDDYSNKTSIYFELDSPAIVKKTNGSVKEDLINKPSRRFVTIKRGLNNKTFAMSSEAVLVENTTIRIQFKDAMDKRENFQTFWHIISRLRQRCNVTIEFRNFIIYYKGQYSSKNDLYCRWASNLKEKTDCVATHPNESAFRLFSENFLKKSDPEDKLAVHYLLEALLSRGSIVKDHLLINQSSWHNFLCQVGEFFKNDSMVCIEALKRLITAIDEQKSFFSIPEAYRLIYEKLQYSNETFGLSDEQKRDGYVMIPRIVITPTRNIRILPEMCMGNRVLRNQMVESKDPCIIVRISFRDDDNSMMRVSKTSEFLLERTIRDAFKNGLFIAGRRYYYLGSSSSQMRDCGAYFMIGCTEADLEKFKCKFPLAEPDDPRMSIKVLRHSLGRFHLLKTAPKIMARLGQCFTQSRVSGICLERHEYTITHDYIGGQKVRTTDPYIFTDGVGSISPAFAEKMANDMRLNSVPSCFQYRFRGHKGVQVVEPYLEQLTNWAIANRIPPPPDHKDIKGSWHLSAIFRPSQIKFAAKRFERQPIEVVKFSGPTAVCLNKPLINIYDQVTAKQSYDCHQRVVNRIEHLLSLQVRNIIKMLLEEKYCRNKLKELPRRIDIDILSAVSGFELCCEPFFRSLVRASVRFTILKQLRKEQIQIPPNLGRSMLGVNDVSDRLQYGQIFVQYTNDVRDYSPHVNAARTILTGKAMVTKNPTSVGGDLRVYEAVDIPELHHLVDVIVFPVHGPRPMPDEMAGSDLDGDEYSVIWDPQLLIEHNVEPALYEPTRDIQLQEDLDKEKLDEAVRDAFIDYVKKDNIGVISNALLFQSDLYGIDSLVVNDLAEKANMAVEFLKSGIAPEKLRVEWENIGTEENPEWLPPEKPERYPDFHFTNDYCPIYHSPRLTGRLYREIKLVEDVLKIVEESESGKDLQLDPLLEYEGWKKFEKVVKEAMEAYNGKLRMVMETYGIKTEAELISGCIVEMRSRITDKDQDDFSYFNQRTSINERVSEIMREAREQFFEDFGGWRTCTREEDAYRDAENVFHRKCFKMSDEIKQKASAFYMVCYNRNAVKRIGQTRMLSFAWLAYDILGTIRQDRVYNLEDHTVYDRPIIRILEDKMQLMVEHPDYQQKLNDFIKKRLQSDGRICRVFRNYCKRYEGLVNILFVLEQWANFNKYLDDRFTDTHLLLLLILFTTGRLGSLNNDPVYLLDWMDINISEEEVLEEKITLVNKGDILLKFFEFISSRKFKTMQHLSFSEIGLNSTFLRGEWIPIHQATYKSYLAIAFSMDFDNLGLNVNNTLRPKILREMDPFVVELPSGTDLPDIENRLIKATGVSEVKLRNIIRRKNDKVVVVCRGNLEACYKLKQLLAVRPTLNMKFTPKELSDILPAITKQNIISASDNAYEENVGET